MAGNKTKEKILIENFDQETDFSKGPWQICSNLSSNSQVCYAEKEGLNGSGCIRLSSDKRNDLYISRRITGLNPRKLYRMTAMMKTSEVKEGRGAVISVNLKKSDQPWNASVHTYGTNDWQQVYVDFVSDHKGEAELCLRLGFFGGTTNGGKAQGTVWYDHIEVGEPPASDIFRRESKHIRLWLDADKVTIPGKQVDAWLKNLDKAYECYRDLVGDVPYEGEKICILTTPGIEKGYWALAGNPILWNSHVAIGDLLRSTVEHNDWGFGIIHEIGHVFSSGNIKGVWEWNWNDEIFANFRMSYALERENGTISQRDIYYKGKNILNYYKIFYDETIGAGIPKNNGDALHYTFLRIKDRYGWNVYRKAFRELYAFSHEDLAHLITDYDKFIFFLSCVSKAAGEDVTSTCYTARELELIRESLTAK
jgi:hypothetical protein